MARNLPDTMVRQAHYEKEAPVKVAPVRTRPKVEPQTDPDRRLNPDRLCPDQKREIVRRIKKNE